MNRTAPRMFRSRLGMPLRPVRSPYFFQDPIRISAMVCAALLMWVREVPFALGLFAVGISQVNGIAMIIDILGRGWSMRGGDRARSTVFTSRLTVDWVNVSICTLVGAMLLMRMFGNPHLVQALGWLTLAIAVTPDVRVCRMVLPEDAMRANRLLTDGYFFRDPVKLGALAAITVISFLGKPELAFIFISMVMLQFNSLLILVDKYLTEIEVSSRGPRPAFRAIQLLINRDGQRLLLALLPLAFVPLRLGAPEKVAQYATGGLAALIVVPDVVRILYRLWLLAWQSMMGGARPATVQRGF